MLSLLSPGRRSHVTRASESIEYRRAPAQGVPSSPSSLPPFGQPNKRSSSPRFSRLDHLGSLPSPLVPFATSLRRRSFRRQCLLLLEEVPDRETSLPRAVAARRRRCLR
jgi:hypothetical protein